MKKTLFKSFAGSLAAVSIAASAVSPVFASEKICPMPLKTHPTYGNHETVSKYSLVPGELYICDAAIRDKDNFYQYTERSLFKVLDVYEDYYLFSLSIRKAKVIDMQTGQERVINCDSKNFYAYDESLGMGIHPEDYESGHFFEDAHTPYGDHQPVHMYDLQVGQIYIADIERSAEGTLYGTKTERHIYKVKHTYEASHCHGAYTERTIIVEDMETGETDHISGDQYRFYEYDEALGKGEC